ncbi:hypothetical protein OROHE_013567 [Orobanche hederae]
MEKGQADGADQKVFQKSRQGRRITNHSYNKPPHHFEDCHLYATAFRTSRSNLLLPCAPGTLRPNYPVYSN